MTRRPSQWLTGVASCLLVALGGHAAAQPGDARTLFQRGLDALHQFEYEDANEAFRQARQIDPGFAMAYWGEAMTYNQTLWRHEDVQAARQVLAQLGPTAAARSAKAVNPRDQGFLAAVDTLFADGDAVTRHQRYADAMSGLYAREPDDPDVASLYALALLGTMSRSLIGYVDAHEGHSQALAGSETQRQVAAILDKILRSFPQHPGALHYLLHNDDDPPHAHLALAAARTLARLAPESSHARHMPSHIFFQLGLWNDAALSDRAAFTASSDWVARKQLNAAMRNYHALSWLQYELLQLGRYREAWATLDELAPVVKASGQLTLLSDLSSMRARYVIETANWQLMARETNFGNVNELFAIGMSAARGGNADLAERARQGLAERAHDPREGDLRPAIAQAAAAMRSAFFRPLRRPRRRSHRRWVCRRRSSRCRSCSAKYWSSWAARRKRYRSSSRRSGGMRIDRHRSSGSRARQPPRSGQARPGNNTARCSSTSTMRMRICRRSAKHERRSTMSA
jgi:hypothetical protein